MKRLFFAAVAILLIAISGWLGFEVWSYFRSPLLASNEISANFVYIQGATAKKLAYSLKEQKLLKNPKRFIVFVRLAGVENKLKAGEYVIEPGLTMRNLIQKMVRGEAVKHAFTIVEGWTFAQLIKALNESQYIRHTIQDLSAAQIMENIGSAGENPEGRFMPDTYLFSGDVADVEILKRAYRTMRDFLEIAWSNKASDLPYHCMYDALIVASMIEKETAKDSEKPMIAGVILRRLEKGMPIQVDPTIIYALGNKFTGKLKKSSLLIRSPYNTYLNKGLPPTPISMPARTSIVAALHPVLSDNLYYVTKGDGTHEFSKSLGEQKTAIKKYLFKKKTR